MNIIAVPPAVNSNKFSLFLNYSVFPMLIETPQLHLVVVQGHCCLIGCTCRKEMIGLTALMALV